MQNDIEPIRSSSKSFKEKVYAVAKLIPKGKVGTYGQLADLVGSPGASRAVGTCMKHNPDGEDVPCYRVVKSDGGLAGYAFGSGITTKKEKLMNEGVTFKGDKVDLGTSLWHPETN